MKVTRQHVDIHQPLITFSELFEDGTEYRKVQIFADGSVGIAGGFIDTEKTWLEEEPLPSVETISERPGFDAIRITPSEFQTEWLASGGW
ncbi:DUF6881 domain-containing protein [Nocardia tengchongensis]|uniref:DUF6881 domain-containing protein n=1 Tax=Nocardia tengchongensis TaxID=2055889 RepID=UPI0036CC6024